MAKKLRLATKSEVVQSSKLADFDSNIGFIYFLIKQKEIVYVGQTINLLNRIKSHKKEKDFDSYAFVEVDEYDLDEMELAYIIEFKPELNKNLPPKNSRYRKLHTFNWYKDINYFYKRIEEAGIKPVFRDYYDGDEIYRFRQAPNKYIREKQALLKGSG